MSAAALVGRQLQDSSDAGALAGVGASVAVQHAARHAARQLRRLQLGRVVQPNLLRTCNASDSVMTSGCNQEQLSSCRRSASRQNHMWRVTC
jgi:hypothetical protein